MGHREIQLIAISWQKTEGRGQQGFCQFSLVRAQKPEIRELEVGGALRNLQCKTLIVDLCGFGRYSKRATSRSKFRAVRLF